MNLRERRSELKILGKEISSTMLIIRALKARGETEKAIEAVDKALRLHARMKKLRLLINNGDSK